MLGKRGLKMKMIKIKFTDGCPNNCSYCYEPTEIITYDPEIPEEEEVVQISDMNFLANPKHRLILDDLIARNKSYELICGVDFRKLTDETCSLMKKANFIKVRWAWDYQFSQQKIHQKVWRMFLKAGYKSEELSVFMLVNYKIPYETCLKKLDLLKVWNVKVNDCCYDGGYPKDEIDYNNNKRFINKRYWTYQDLKNFRARCRTHNQMVRFKIDPEVK